jgi:hypothetical protein
MKPFRDFLKFAIKARAFLNIPGFLSWHQDTQHNDIQHNDTQVKGLIWDTHQNNTLPYTECRFLFIVMLNVVMLDVVMLNVGMLSVLTLSVVVPLPYPQILD